jgi:hypothetical protein
MSIIGIKKPILSRLPKYSVEMKYSNYNLLKNDEHYAKPIKFLVRALFYASNNRSGLQQKMQIPKSIDLSV